MSRDPIEVIENSAFFSADWYQRIYPDVRSYDRSPAHHYTVFGAEMGRDPGPAFSSAGYLSRNPEVAQVGHNPLWHYELFGKHEGRDPSPSAVTDPLILDPIRCSEIDRDLPELLPAAARSNLATIFAMQLQGKPHRFLTEFDHDSARRFVNALCAQQTAELAARNTRVSVVMPTFNRAGTLGRAIQSVLSQSHHNIELIVVDDGSTDFTADVVQGYRADPRLVYCRSEHGGVSAARNLGLSRTNGTIIFYLDSDNLWTRDFIRLMVMSLQISGAQCAYAGTRLHDQNGDVVGYRGEPFDWAHCINGNYVDLNVFCHHRDLIKNEGVFDTSLRRMVDWDLVLRYTKHYHPVYCPFIGCLYSDDTQDKTRISTSKPYIFERVVSHKNAVGFSSLPETLADLRFSIALKVGQETPENLMVELTNTLADQGHTIRADGPENWKTRHPHEDEVVVIMPGADAYPPHSEQVNLRLGDLADQAGIHGHVAIKQRNTGQIAQDLLDQVTKYLTGKPK